MSATKTTRDYWAGNEQVGLKQGLDTVTCEFGS